MVQVDEKLVAVDDPLVGTGVTSDLPLFLYQTIVMLTSVVLALAFFFLPTQSWKSAIAPPSFLWVPYALGLLPLFAAMYLLKTFSHELTRPTDNLRTACFYWILYLICKFASSLIIGVGDQRSILQIFEFAFFLVGLGAYVQAFSTLSRSEGRSTGESTGLVRRHSALAMAALSAHFVSFFCVFVLARLGIVPRPYLITGTAQGFPFLVEISWTNLVFYVGTGIALATCSLWAFRRVLSATSSPLVAVIVSLMTGLVAPANMLQALEPRSHMLLVGVASISVMVLPLPFFIYMLIMALDLRLIAKQEQERTWREQRKSAIMSIVIDSFSHNVVAHSMKAILGILHGRRGEHDELRASVAELGPYGKEREPEFDQIPAPACAPFSTLPGSWESSTPASELPLSDENESELSLHGPMHGFLRYLEQKALFWNAVMQQKTYGGESISWWELLEPFFGNALFAGTLATSDNITTLVLVVNGTPVFETSVSPLMENLHSDEKKLPPKGSTADGNSTPPFLFKAKLLGDSHRLKNESVFLPGGVVGRQAFYTILENVIRNIKHCIPEKSTTLFVHIVYTEDHKVPGDGIGRTGVPNAVHSHLWDVTMWLSRRCEDLKYKLDEMREDLRTPLVSKGKPHLKGTSQSRVCASMLMTGDFGGETPDGRFVGYSLPRGSLLSFVDFAVQDENPFWAASTDTHEVLKTRFKLWKGGKTEDLDWLNELEEPGFTSDGLGLIGRMDNEYRFEIFENLRRHKILELPHAQLLRKAEELGVVFDAGMRVTA